MIITAPPLGSLVGNLPTAAWFRGAYADRAASPRNIARVSAVGLVARLWRTAGSPHDLFAAAVDGHALGRAGAFGNASDGGSDIINVGDLDRDAIAEATSAEASKFYDKYQLMLDGHAFKAFEGPRDMAIRMGLVRVEEKAVEAGPGEVAFPWKNLVSAADSRRDWTDIATPIDRQEFMAKYACCFNPNATWAVLDEDGWHEPGTMGWFACDDSSPESYVAYKRSFMDKFINNARADDVLVCVDCHI